MKNFTFFSKSFLSLILLLGLFSVNTITAQDNDNDGILDTVDLDDDNDGILDTVEDACVITPDYLDPDPLVNTEGNANTSVLTTLNGQQVTWITPTATGSFHDISGSQIRYVSCNGDVTSTALLYDVTVQFPQPVTNFEMLGFDFDFTRVERILNFSVLPTDISANSMIDTSGIFTSTSDDQDVTLAWNLAVPVSEITFTIEREVCGRGLSFEIGFSGICDADGDGIANSLDVDSDNDGCSDANEQYGTAFGGVNQIDTNGDGTYGAAIGAGDVNADGTIAGLTYVIAKNSNVTTVGDDTDSDGIIDTCDDEFNDIDNDGVADAVDLDDDNDGILDSDEMFCDDIDLDLSSITNQANSTVNDIPILNSSGVDSGATYSSSITSSSSTDTGRPRGYASGSLGMGVVHSSGNTQFIEYTFTFSSPVLLNLKQSVANGNFDENEDWTITTPGVSLVVDTPFINESKINDINNLDGDNNLDTGPELREVVGNGTSTVSFRPNVVSGHIDPSNSQWTIKSTDYISSLIIRYEDNSGSSNGNQRGAINISLSCIAIDTDGDGIVDYLDTDSDGDGCSDALEGDGGFTLASVDANGALTATVDADGIPNGISQNNVSATDATVTADECDDDGDGIINSVDICDGYDDTVDNDTDGLPDGCDLDDDNDGIPDLEENITCITTTNLNSQNLALDTDLTGGGTNSVTLSGLDNGVFDFTADLSGTANWDKGIQIQNNSEIGDFLYAQPQATGNTSGTNSATYTFDFPTPVKGFSFIIGGLNNNDQVTITAFNGTNAITITPDNFAGLDNGIVVSGNSVQGTKTDNDFDPLIHIFSTYIPEEIDRLVITSGKADNNTAQVTLGFYSFGYCIADANADFDGDGIPNHLDLDSDNDGITDIVEAAGTDANNDGEVDYPTVGDPTTIVDANMNGLDDALETTPLVIANSDALGGPNYLDIDADDDGIPDNIEAQTTAGYIPPSGTGLAITDANSNGVDDAYEIGGTIGFIPVNTDSGLTNSDSLPDYIDDDSDGDGIADIAENGNVANAILGVDADADGLDDAFDDFDDSAIAGNTVNNGINTPDGSNLGDEDGDLNSGGDVDYRDAIDHDNDGITDNADLDDDNDGIPDTEEAAGLPVPSEDLDNDGIPNYLDIDNGVDANSDGVVDAYDTDGDGIPNHFDLDSDNDGIYDVVETDNSTLDTDGNGSIDATESPVGNNGIPDSAESGTEGGTPTTPIPSTDTDGIPNYLDIDSDDDGIPDNVEGQTTADYAAPFGNDTDGDGIDDAYDADFLATNSGINPVDTDGNTTENLPDYLDTDADDDGVSDTLEAGFTDDGLTTDTDGDGLLDTFEGTDNNDGFDVNDQLDGGAADTNNDDNTATPEVDFRETEDNDNDGILDAFDLDDDNDGIPDSVEGDADFDNDGIKDSFDLDSDNDGIADIIEAEGIDANGDGLVDNFTDVDNDGLHDPLDDTNGSVTNGTPLVNPNTDGDAFDNRIDIDSDNDGIPDNVEAQTTTGYISPSGTYLANGFDSAYPVALTPINTDSDTKIPDYVDTDSDDDGIDDVVEADSGTLLNVDTDGDGLDDGFEGSDVTDQFDVNDEIEDPTALPDDQLPGGDVDYRDAGVTALPVDTDGDGVLDDQEVADGTAIDNPCDFIIASITEAQSGDYLAADCDGDGVTNGTEIADGTNPEDSCDFVAANVTEELSGDYLILDCDGDGVTNGTEIADGTDPLDSCDSIITNITEPQTDEWLTSDCDDDTIQNSQEITDGTDPYDACSSIGGTPPAGSDCETVVSIETDLVNPGVNDGIFHINNIESYPTNTVKIFNRWGVLVFETEGYDNNSRAFSGVSNGRVTISAEKELPVGIYFYIIEYVDEDKATVLDGYLYLNR